MADLKYVVEVETRGAETNIGNLQGALKGLAAAFGIGAISQFTQSIIAAGRTAENYANQLRLITGSTEELTRVTTLLQATAVNNRASFGATSDLFTKLTLSTEELGVSEERLIGITTKLSQALSISGADAATTNSVVRQFGQAMASGTVRGDEFNSIVEGIGPALSIMARESGLTVGKLREMSQAGELTAAVMLKLFENSTTLAAAFNQTIPSISQLETAFSDAFGRALDRIGQVSGITERYKELLVLVGRELDKISGAPAALANLKPDNIFKGIQDGSVQAQAGLAELETRLMVVKRTLEATPGAALAIGGLGDRYRSEIATLEELIPKVKELKEVQAAAAAEQADNLALRKIEQDSVKMLLEPYQEAITIGKDYVKQNIDNRTSAEKLRDELEKAYSTLYQLKEAQGVAGNSTESFTALIEGAESKVRQLELQLQRLQTALNLEVYAIKATTEGFERNLDLALKRSELETRMLSMTREEAEVARATGSFRQQMLGQTAALEDRINKIREVGTDEEKKLLPVLEAQRDRYAEIERRQLPLIERQAKIHAEAMDQVEAQKKAEQEAIRERDKAEREAESERKKAARELQKLQEEFQKRRLDAEKQISSFQFDAGERLRDQYADLELEGLFGVQKTLKEIELQERRTADAARQRLKEQFGEKDPEGLAAAIAQIDSAAEESLRKRQEAARAIAQEQRSFESGWRRAWGSYADDANNASKQAERLFTKSTQGMEDAIVGFAKTGKFEWKDFVNVILEELLRSNLRKLIADVFAPANGSGGTAGAQRLIGSAPGVANTNSAAGSLSGLGGGPQAQNSGGGLLGSLGSLFGGGGSTRSSAESFPVSAPAATTSLSDFVDFGGFFANGGTIPAGKFGVVGERGPEFISGPANITPMGGMGTTVNYTVNAVDARSFQDLLATDPRTLFAITEQGRKSLPGYRR